MELRSLVEHLRNNGCLLLRSEQSVALGVLATQILTPTIELNSKNVAWTCFVANEVMLDNFIPDVPEVVYQLLEASENRITLSFCESERINIGFSSSGAYKLRIASDQSMLRLIQMLRQPLAVTSISAEEIDRFSKSNPCINIENQDLCSTDMVAFYSDGSFKLFKESDTR